MFTQKHNHQSPLSQPTSQSMRVQPQSTALAQSQPARRIISLANTFFLIILSFFAGYNLKAYQVKEVFDQRIAASNQYMDDIKRNHDASEKILHELNTRVQTHFETKIHPSTPVPTVTETPPQVTVASIEIPEAVEATDVAPAPSARPDNTTATPVPVETIPKATPVLPTNHAVQPRPMPSPPVPFMHVRHRVQDGDVLSALVPRRNIGIFLHENPAITDPDQIFPGQNLLIRVPLQNVERGTYMNHYFIRPCITDCTESKFRLTEWLTLPENQTAVEFLIHENRTRIRKSTIPFINLSDEANRIKDSLWHSAQGRQNTINRIRRINAAHGPMLFRTDRLDTPREPAFYQGVRESGFTDIRQHSQAIQKDMNRLYSGILQGKPGQGMYHFMIFGDTVVQSAFLTEDNFKDSPNKQKILIGVIYATQATGQALNTLKHAVGICRVKPGDMVELSPKNLTYFLK